MKKITGKALSLVLSIALVASSFSASFASASTKTVNGTVDLKTDDAATLCLVNGGKDSQQTKVDLSTWFTYQQGKNSKASTSMDTPDHQDVSDPKIIDVSHVSGDKLVKWGDPDGKKIDEDKDTWLTLKSSKDDGKEVISVLFKGTYTDDNGNDVDVKARTNVTINVADKGKVYVGKYYNDTDLAARVGMSVEDPDALAEASDNAQLTPFKDSAYVDSQAVGMYYATPSATDAKATYVRQSFALDTSDTLDNPSNTVATTNSGFTLKVTGSTSKLLFAQGAPADSKLTIYALDGVKNGSLTFTANHTKTTNHDLATDVKDDKVTAKGKIAKKVEVYNWLNVGKDKKTYLYTGNLSDGKASGDTATVNGTKVTYTALTATKIDVTGYDIDLKLPGQKTFTIDDKSASVGKITGKVNTLEIKNGTVSSVDLDNGDVSVGDAKVGDITTDKKSDANLYGNPAGKVDVSDGTVGNIDANDAVTVTSGTTGDIKTDADIEVDGNDSDSTTVVGNVTGGGETTIDADNSKVSAKSYKAKDDNAKLTLKGNNVALSKMDFDYREDSTLSFDDFQGKLASPINATKTTIETTDEDDDVSFTGAATVDTVDLTDSSKVAFDNTLKTQYVTGSGTLKLPLGSLYVVDSVSGSPILKFSNDFKVGDTAFKADNDAVEADDFNCFGFTLSKSEGSSVDTFKIASTKFAGLVIDPSSARIAKGTQYAQTFKASAYPSGTAIPSGDKIAWDFNGEDANFKTTANADGSYTVEVIAVDPNFSSENTGTVIAKLVDASGDDDSDYDAAKCTVTALTNPDATFTSDTGATVTVAQGASYTFKITSLDGKEPTFGVGSNAFSVTKVGKSGNAYFFKITATGAVKTSVGVYANGVRTCVATIGASTVKVDTTKVTIKTGASYTFKVSGTSVKPTFTSGNAAVAKVVSSSASAGSYFFKVSAVKAGSTGIYVNGVRAAVVTVA